MVCEVNKVRRADTEQFFSAFGIEMAELPLTASATARREEARKEEAKRPTINGRHSGMRWLVSRSSRESTQFMLGSST